MLVNVFDLFNPRHTFTFTLDPIVPNDYLFETPNSNDNSSEGLLRLKLFYILTLMHFLGI
jgi:hypothetical protein